MGFELLTVEEMFIYYAVGFSAVINDGEVIGFEYEG